MKNPALKLKKLNKKDLIPLKVLMNNKQVLEELEYNKTKYTIQDAKNELAKNRKYKFGIFEKNELVGKIGLTKEDKSQIFEVGYVVSPNNRKKGIATWALREICKKGFREFGAIRIHARVLLKNKTSQNILKKCGFKLEGHLKKSSHINNKYYDELIFAKTK